MCIKNYSNGITFLDGGFGTMMQAAGLPAGKDPVDWNIENPNAVIKAHRAYVEAGAQIVLSNTFGANELKYHGDHDLGELIAAAIRNAWAAEPQCVALDLGPTGKLLKPAGDLDFNKAYDAYAHAISLATDQSACASGFRKPSLVFIETMGDAYELKAAVLAAKENCELPVFATVALGDDGKLLTGGSVKCVATLLESLGVDAYGFNCGLGPDRMLPFVERLANVSTRPIIVKPNAGMPHLVDGKTVFDVSPRQFAANVADLVSAGAAIVGGCCGTTPEHISELRNITPVIHHDNVIGSKLTDVSSGTESVGIKPYAGLIIGERINPTGKKLLKEAFAKGDTAYVLREAVKQVEAGAAILDVNCGVPGLDEAALLESTVLNVQSVSTVPIQIDTADPIALERAMRIVNGKALVNSVNGKQESMDAVFPIVKRHGGTIVALCLDENGIPKTCDGRIEVARKILAAGEKYGFSRRDFVFDALTLSISTDPTAATVTLETVRRLTCELGVNTVLGVSNVSFGLPNRAALNNAMYALAKKAGLSAAIANPSLIRDEADPAAVDVLLGRDANCEKWIAINADCSSGSEHIGAAIVNPQQHGGCTVCDSVVHGLKADAAIAAKNDLARGIAPLDIIEKGIVPALEQVGGGFERGKVFLPQLLMAADAAGEAFAVVRQALASAERTCSESKREPIVLATVKGDIHDIGKNIVRALLENYGFDVIDLGRDVPPETIVESVRRNRAKLVGLSALMTTTVGAMAETIRLIKNTELQCKTVVGGAVVTQEFADSIGADFYAKDAMRTVRIAESICR